MNYSATNCNLHMNYENYPLNKGTKTRSISFAGQPDTVSLSTHNQTGENSGLSRNTQWGLGAIAILAIGTAAYIFSKGKVGNKSVQQLSEHIEFQPAKSIEEARAFAKDRLGVQVVDDMCLDVMNYTNESLCTLRNKSPKDFKIKWIECKEISGEYDTTSTAQVLEIKDMNIHGINISRNYIKNIDRTLTDLINGEIDRNAMIEINGELQYNDFFKKANISNEISELANKFRQNSSSLNFKEKVKLHQGLGDIGEEMDKLFFEYNGDVSRIKDVVNIISSPFHPIIHEQGHILHKIKINDEKFALLDKINIINQKKLDSSTYNEFKDKYSSIASRVSEYAVESPAEFVAEVYAKTLEGAKFDKEILNLYAKYEGHPLP